MNADPAAEHDEDAGAYCRAIEAHLCRKNDGHLIRISGPAFDLVRGWAEQGIPLRVADERHRSNVRALLRQRPSTTARAHHFL